MVCGIEGLQDFLKDNAWFLWTMFGIALVIEIILICGLEYARKVPINYILLITFTVCFSFVIGSICSMYEPGLVLGCALATLGIAACLMLYAYFTKTDFTKSIGIVIVVL
mmetsp:Transcript_23929/g.11516  ORF Transcript_23929/g.11516 Transcript_23929/m.11516 type:complete len:110 (-) Transcript_23929:11-340(-)